MTKTELFKSLTDCQQIEFDNDINLAIRKMIETGNVYHDKLHEVNIHLRLENEIFLSATIEFVKNIDNQIHGNVTQILKFKTVNEYLDSINNQKRDKNKNQLNLD